MEGHRTRGPVSFLPPGESPLVLVEVRVSLALDQKGSPVVILRELDGERVVPIWIGHTEAYSILTQLEEDHAAVRPLSQDLLLSVLRSLGGEVLKVNITDMQDGTFYAELILRGPDGEVVSLDARPSDSIAVALRAGAVIFAEDELLEDGTIKIAADGAVSGVIGSGPVQDEGNLALFDFSAFEDLKGMGPEELEEHLRRLDPEDFGRFNP